MTNKDKILAEQFKNQMDECLESINGDGWIKRVEINRETGEIHFIFNIIECEDQETWIGY